MLDAFIIERIRQQQRRHRESQPIPLRIEAPENDPRRPEDAREEEKPQRGVIIVDFSV